MAHGEVRAEVGTLRAGVRAEAVKGCSQRSHSLKCCVEPACQGGQGGPLVDECQAGGTETSPSLCAWPEETGSASQVEARTEAAGAVAPGDLGVLCLSVPKATRVLGAMSVP